MTSRQFTLAMATAVASTVADRDRGSGSGSPGSEPGQAFGIARDVVGKDLEGDVPRQAGIVGAIHRAHAAGTERASDLVRTESGSRHKRHVQPGLVHAAPPGKAVASGGSSPPLPFTLVPPCSRMNERGVVYSSVLRRERRRTRYRTRQPAAAAAKMIVVI